MSVDRVKRTIGRAMAAAVAALVVSFAFAHPPHGGGPGVARWGLRPTWATGPSHRGGLAAGPAYGAAYARYPGGSPYRSVSTASSSLPRPSGPADGAMRSSSIRADVTRYNEERGARPPAPRGQDGGVSRGTFFSSFYRNR